MVFLGKYTMEFSYMCKIQMTGSMSSLKQTLEQFRFSA